MNVAAPQRRWTERITFGEAASAAALAAGLFFALGCAVIAIRALRTGVPVVELLAVYPEIKIALIGAFGLVVPLMFYTGPQAVNLLTLEHFSRSEGSFDPHLASDLGRTFQRRFRWFLLVVWFLVMPLSAATIPGAAFAWVVTMPLPVSRRGHLKRLALVLLVASTFHLSSQLQGDPFPARATVKTVGGETVSGSLVTNDANGTYVIAERRLIAMPARQIARVTIDDSAQPITFHGSLGYMILRLAGLF